NPRDQQHSRFFGYSRAFTGKLGHPLAWFAQMVAREATVLVSLPRSLFGDFAMTKPESVGLSAMRLERLDRAMTEEYVDTQQLPGFLVQVFRRGALAHTGTAGRMDIERGKKMQEDAIFRIYSMTKPITALALMMLVEEGRISLDDDVHTFIPSWKDLRV